MIEVEFFVPELNIGALGRTAAEVAVGGEVDDREGVLGTGGFEVFEGGLLVFEGAGVGPELADGIDFGGDAGERRLTLGGFGNSDREHFCVAQIAVPDVRQANAGHEANAVALDQKIGAVMERSVGQRSQSRVRKKNEIANVLGFEFGGERADEPLVELLRRPEVAGGVGAERIGNFLAEGFGGGEDTRAIGGGDEFPDDAFGGDEGDFEGVVGFLADRFTHELGLGRDEGEIDQRGFDSSLAFNLLGHTLGICRGARSNRSSPA